MVDNLASRGTPFAVAAAVKTEGSSLGKPGFKVIISGEAEVLYGSLGLDQQYVRATSPLGS